jgi:putative aminopeptidase FrvX
MMKFDDPKKVRNLQQLYIDFGANSKQEAEDLGIKVGDSITWYPHFDYLSETRVSGKAFDDRAGCAVLIKALEELDRGDFNGEVVGIFTVQEEVGLRGARVASHQLVADVALALDTTAVSDTPEEMMDQTLSLGNGTGIKVLDFSLVANKKVRDHLVEMANEYRIHFQMEVFAGIGTDAGELSLANQGIPTGVLSIPSRYAHSSIEVLDLNDLTATKDLLVVFIKNMKYSNDYKFKI